MAKYICINDCFHNGIRYYEGEIYEFPDKEKVPHHFEVISKPKEEVKKSKGLKKLQDELKQLLSLSAPHPAQVKRIEELKTKITEIIGEE